MRLLLLSLWLSCMLSANIDLPENFEADFTQKITNTKNKVIEYRGNVRFSDKVFFKWNYIEPTQKEVCTNGFELLVVDHDLEQVSTYLVNDGLDIGKILEKAKEHTKNIYIAEFENKKYTIQLDKTDKLHSIAYYDDLDNKVQIVFKHIIYGKGKLPDAKILCDYPKNYDMIRG